MTLWITIGQSCGDDTRGKQQSRMEIFPVEKPGAELIPIATSAQGRTIEHISVNPMCVAAQRGAVARRVLTSVAGLARRLRRYINAYSAAEVTLCSSLERVY